MSETLAPVWAIFLMCFLYIIAQSRETLRSTLFLIRTLCGAGAQSRETLRSTLFLIRTVCGAGEADSTRVSLFVLRTQRNPSCYVPLYLFFLVKCLVIFYSILISVWVITKPHYNIVCCH
jgi:hypothetical protein